MADPFIGEIRMFSFDYAPQGWAACNGQFLPINQNQHLYSVISNIYGADNISTFALPNFQGRAPVATDIFSNTGRTFGTATVTLTTEQMPSHTHTLQFSQEAAGRNSPANNLYALATIYTNLTNSVTTAAEIMDFKGDSAPHNNMMPYLTLNFCIALQGIYPPRQ